MGDTKIEYLDKCWNFMTGCVHDIVECPCKNDCWARSRAVRFNKGYFLPQLHQDKLLEPLSIKKPSKIGVCFTGDLIGGWVDEKLLVDVSRNELFGENLKHGKFWELSTIVSDVIFSSPQHQFLFLTKSPQNYHKWLPLPKNAWLGASVCNSDMFDKSFRELMKVEAKIKWLSFEPLLDWTHTINLEKPLSTVQWVAIGGQTGRHKILPNYEWVREIVKACDKNKTPIFLKNNLNSCEVSDYPELLDVNGDLRQEYPSSELL
jgi:protein gp37